MFYYLFKAIKQVCNPKSFAVLWKIQIFCVQLIFKSNARNFWANLSVAKAICIEKNQFLSPQAAIVVLLSMALVNVIRIVIAICRKRVMITELKNYWRKCTGLFPYNELQLKTWWILSTPLVLISHIISTDQQRGLKWFSLFVFSTKSRNFVFILKKSRRKGWIFARLKRFQNPYRKAEFFEPELGECNSFLCKNLRKVFKIDVATQFWSMLISWELGTSGVDLTWQAWKSAIILASTFDAVHSLQ